MSELISDSKIQEIITATCQANGCVKLAKGIQARWSNHIVSKTGQFSLRDNSITLAAKVLQNLTHQGQAEAVSRETCNLICWHLFNSTAHEQQWRFCMGKAGYPEARYKQDLPFKKLKRKAYSKFSNFVFSCGCPRKPYQLNAIIGKNIALDGKAYECDKCHKNIVLVKNHIAEAS